MITMNKDGKHKQEKGIVHPFSFVGYILSELLINY
jgi:hypothetical protein